MSVEIGSKVREMLGEPTAEQLEHILTLEEKYWRKVYDVKAELYAGAVGEGDMVTGMRVKVNLEGPNSRWESAFIVSRKGFILVVPEVVRHALHNMRSDIKERIIKESFHGKKHEIR